MKKKLLIGGVALLATMTVSVATTVATATYAPQLLPQGKQGQRGAPGPIGPRGLPGEDGRDAGTVSAAADAGVDQTTSSGGDDATDSGVDQQQLDRQQAEIDAAKDRECARLYKQWQDGDPVTGERDTEAIQQHGQMLCDQR